MSPGIFLIDTDNRLVELREEPYDSEDLLQRLLADHPSILAGQEDGSATSRRWLLITREAEVPDAADAPGRWSVDHVFLDQDAVPTLIEVKRSSDTRIRREVVGQMLDYAANALAYWPADRLQTTYEARCASLQVDPAADFARVLGSAVDPEAFWRAAKTNLQAGKIRMVFVADEVPAELRRVVEFLNEQMEPAEVLAVEVRQYVGSGMRTLVPTVVGRTAESEQRKGNSPRGAAWDQARFMSVIKESQGEGARHAAELILEWAAVRRLLVSWGKGRQAGSFVPAVPLGDNRLSLFAVYTSGKVELDFRYYMDCAPFTQESARRELQARLNAIPGVAVPDDALGRFPSFQISALAAPGALDQLLRSFDWLIDEVRAQHVRETRPV